jgi:hypothetical protein
MKNQVSPHETPLLISGGRILHGCPQMRSRNMILLYVCNAVRSWPQYDLSEMISASSFRTYALGIVRIGLMTPAPSSVFSARRGRPSDPRDRRFREAAPCRHSKGSEARHVPCFGTIL